MMYKWMVRTGKMICKVLVNSPKGSLFIEYIDTSDSSTCLLIPSKCSPCFRTL